MNIYVQMYLYAYVYVQTHTHTNTHTVPYNLKVNYYKFHWDSLKVKTSWEIVENFQQDILQKKVLK